VVENATGSVHSAVSEGLLEDTNAWRTTLSEHAVIVKFDYGSTDLSALFELEDQLEALLEDSSVGEYDGHEIAVDGSDGLLYLYGPDADALFNKVKPTLAASANIRNAVATLRYGPPNDDTPRVTLTIAA
jgi:hypothetical protein